MLGGWRRQIGFASLAALGLLISACGSGIPGPPAAGLGTVEHRSVPESIAHLPLTNQRGDMIDLAAFRRRTVLIVPFLTLCTDICPFDTGDLLQVQRALAADHVASKVQLMEMSIDPRRDTPSRLAAYAHLTGASWELVTETPGEAAQLEHFFGWAVQQVPEDDPPSIDWWTGRPLTYDVDHSDGFVVVDTQGVERFSTAAAPDFRGTLNATLHKFLSSTGREHLAHPPSPGWDPATAMQTLGWMLHQSLPLVGTQG